MIVDKACFQLDRAGLRNFDDLPRRADSNKVLRHKAFNIAKIPKSDGY